VKPKPSFQVVPPDPNRPLSVWDGETGELSDGSPFPARVDVWAQSNSESPVILRLEVANGGELVVSAVQVISRGPGSQVTSSLLRIPAVAELAEQAIAYVAENYFVATQLPRLGIDAFTAFIGAQAGWPETDETKAILEALDTYRAQALKGRQRRKLTPEFLAEVAKVFTSAEKFPTKAVQLHYSTEKRTAARWIAAARAAGYLPKRESRP
jgi:hypothetical protein